MVIADCSVKTSSERSDSSRKPSGRLILTWRWSWGCFFSSFSRADVQFTKWEFVQKTYTGMEALPTTKRVEIIHKKEFALVALNADNKTFVIHVVALVKPKTILIYTSCQA